MHVAPIAVDYKGDSDFNPKKVSRYYIKSRRPVWMTSSGKKNPKVIDSHWKWGETCITSVSANVAPLKRADIGYHVFVCYWRFCSACSVFVDQHVRRNLEMTRSFETYHILAWITWLPFYRRHFQMHTFLKQNIYLLIWISWRFVYEGPLLLSTKISPISHHNWLLTGYKPLPDPMLIQFYDTIWCH